jgi:hypothetical protein
VAWWVGGLVAWWAGGLVAWWLGGFGAWSVGGSVAWSLVSKTKMTCPTLISSPAFTGMSRIFPPKGLGISVVALSVSTSMIDWSASIVSPTETSTRARNPVTTLSAISGKVISFFILLFGSSSLHSGRISFSWHNI